MLTIEEKRAVLPNDSEENLESAGGPEGAAEGGTPKPAGEWTGKSRGSLGWYYGFYVLLRLFGLRGAYSLLFIVVPYFMIVELEAARAALEFRRRAGRKEDNPISVLWGTARHFFTYGQLLIDRVAVLILGRDHYQIIHEKESRIDQIVAEGNGVMLLSAHYGCFEMAAQAVGSRDIPVNVVAYDTEVEALREFYNKFAKNRAFNIIPVKGDFEDSLAIVAALRRGEVVAMMADRNLSSNLQHSIRVPFLGKPARFATGPFKVAAIAGAPVVGGFLTRCGTACYSLDFHYAEHLKFERDRSRDEQLYEWVSRYAARLESFAGKNPFQWRNLYPFWASNYNHHKETDS